MANLGVGENQEPDSIDASGNIIVLNLPGGISRTITSNEWKWRQELISAVGAEGYDNVVERVAYTWFNRLIAIRYMEVNDYLPTHVRVLSSSDRVKIEPDIVTQCIRMSDVFGLRDIEKKEIIELKDKNKLDDLFSRMFLHQCKALNKVLPNLFTVTKPYENLLLNLSYTVPGGVVRNLVDMIPEEDFKDTVQIIGWMYQFYNTELKDKVFSDLKKNVKISKEHIPAATQLFTPDWIVRYMVENSLGRVWLEGHEDSDLKSKWKYYLDEVEQEPEVISELKKIRSGRADLMPSDIKVMDPCMGSGHILVYAFDVLMQIYESYGYAPSDAAEMIVTRNLYGLDIDDRAYQLAYFAVMMKARQYDPRVFSKNLKPNLYSMPESSGISLEVLNEYGRNLPPMDRTLALNDLSYLLQMFRNAKLYGSLLKPRCINYDQLWNLLNDCAITVYNYTPISESLKNIVSVAELLFNKYDSVITNPPYLAASGMSADLASFVKEHYKDSKSDLFACFIERCIQFTRDSGYTSMITQHAFMFLSSFEKLRLKLCSNDTIINLVHLGPRAFDQIGGEVVQSVSFVLSLKTIKNYQGTYIRLIDEKGEKEKESKFLSGEDRFYIKQDIFDVIPGVPIAYWLSNTGFGLFSNKSIIQFGRAIEGLKTGNNDLFLRNWYEVDLTTTNISETTNIDKLKWFKTAKAGEHRRWYGSHYIVTNFKNNGEDIIRYGHGSIPKVDISKPSITWNRIGVNNLAFRYLPAGFLSNMGGLCFYLSNIDKIYELLAFLNSDITQFELEILNPTISFPPGTINNIRFVKLDNSDSLRVTALSKECVESSKFIWNHSELSWDFDMSNSMKETVENTIRFLFSTVQQHQQIIIQNSIMINEIYYKRIGNNIKIRSFDKKDINLQELSIVSLVKQLISYSIGCMFGRYSLDNPGLQFAGGKFHFTEQRFPVDPDNIIPINDTGYFGDDIVSYFIKFIKTAFGEEHLDENLKFIANNLGMKSSGTTRDIIRRYFLNDFYKDHLKMYSNLPIYWLFDSGKENGFKALVYLHRYTPDLIIKMRQDYFLPRFSAYSELLKNAEGTMRAALQRKIEEIQTYDIAMEKYASDKVSIDLDDGIKVNYAKFQNIDNPGSKRKINLLYPLK